MSFNLGKVLCNNLIDGYRNGSFNEQQVINSAGMYLAKAIITEEDFTRVFEVVYPPVVEEEI